MMHVVGIGPGHPDFQLKLVEELAEEVDIIYGSDRQLKALSERFEDKKKVWSSNWNEGLQEVKSQLEELEMMYLASGDPMIYGIGSYFLRSLGKKWVRVYPGISSTQYLFAKIGLSMNDCFITSSHGRQPDFDLIANLPKTVMVTDQKIGPFEIAQELIKRKRQTSRMVVGENLSYANESIQDYVVEDVPDREYDQCVVVILNEG